MASSTQPVTSAGRLTITEQEDPLLARMDPGETYGLDELVEATGTAASKLLPRLMELELRGQIAAVGGGRFARGRGESGIDGTPFPTVMVIWS